MKPFPCAYKAIDPVISGSKHCANKNSVQPRVKRYVYICQCVTKTCAGGHSSIKNVAGAFMASPVCEGHQGLPFALLHRRWCTCVSQPTSLFLWLGIYLLCLGFEPNPGVRFSFLPFPISDFAFGLNAVVLFNPVSMFQLGVRFRFVIGGMWIIERGTISED